MVQIKSMEYLVRSSDIKLGGGENDYQYEKDEREGER